MTTIQDWKAKSKCLGQETLYESVSHGANERINKPKDLANVAKAKKLCISCPVQRECLESAMNEEAYLSGIERHGIRGGLTARDRIVIAMRDPMCARCRINPVVQSTTVAKMRRLCASCQSSTQNDMTARYFPPGAEPLENFLQPM